MHSLYNLHTAHTIHKKYKKTTLHNRFGMLYLALGLRHTKKQQRGQEKMENKLNQNPTRQLIESTLDNCNEEQLKIVLRFLLGLTEEKEQGA